MCVRDKPLGAGVVVALGEGSSTRLWAGGGAPAALQAQHHAQEQTENQRDHQVALTVRHLQKNRPNSYSLKIKCLSLILQSQHMYDIFQFLEREHFILFDTPWNYTVIDDLCSAAATLTGASIFQKQCITDTMQFITVAHVFRVVTRGPSKRNCPSAGTLSRLPS